MRHIRYLPLLRRNHCPRPGAGRGRAPCTWSHSWSRASITLRWHAWREQVIIIVPDFWCFHSDLLDFLEQMFLRFLYALMQFPKTLQGWLNSTQLIIREMQMKTTMRYYLTPIRMAIIKKKTTNNKSWTGCGEQENPLHGLWECKLIQPLWRTVWRFLNELGIKVPSVCLDTQLCLTLCDPMDCSPPGSSVHEDSPDKNTGVGCRALLQGIFLTKESNWGLLHCRRILYQLSYQGSPIPLLGIYPEKTIIQKDTCTPMFLAPLFTYLQQPEHGSNLDVH